MKEERPWSGLAIKDREPAHIKAALDGQDPLVVQQALALHEYAGKRHLGLSQLSHQSGIPSSILSQLFNGTYNGDFVAVAERIEKFFWRLEQKEKYGGIRAFVKTRLAQVLWDIFEKTRVIRRIQVIQSPEQLGKTRAAEEYTALNNSGRTVYLSLSGGSREGTGNFIWNLADALQIPYSVKLLEKRLRIKHALEACDLVIIDEAHLMWEWRDRSIVEFLNYLRTDIFANGARGIVLLSTNDDMMENVRRLKGRTRHNVGQLLGRMRNEVMAIDPVEDILEEDVRLLVGRYFQNGTKVSNETVKRLHAIAQRPQLGHFGLVEDIMNEAYTRAKAKKRNLDDKVVAATADAIMNELKGRKELYS